MIHLKSAESYMFVCPTYYILTAHRHFCNLLVLSSRLRVINVLTDISHQSLSELDPYGRREPVFNQELASSLLGDQWPVK